MPLNNSISIKQVVQISILLILIVKGSILNAQSWEAGIELGASFVAPSSFGSQNGLNTVFFTPGIYTKRKIGDHWQIFANASFTRFNYYKTGTTYEEGDNYIAILGAGRSFAHEKISVEVGLGVMHWRYVLNNLKTTDFSIEPTIYYQITNPKKTKFNASIFARYPFSFQAGIYGWFSAGTRLGLRFPEKK